MDTYFDLNMRGLAMLCIAFVDASWSCDSPYYIRSTPHMTTTSTDLTRLTLRTGIQVTPPPVYVFLYCVEQMLWSKNVERYWPNEVDRDVMILSELVFQLEY
jgi:hypothetical protein